ncbi:MAG: tetratricopeptide repeat protein, partial [Lysobacterales bacterium]
MPKPIAGPDRNGRIATSIYEVRPGPGGSGLILDIGLALNMNDPLEDLPIDLSGAFELQDSSGRFLKADPAMPGLHRPLGKVVIRRDQIVRGEVAFPGASRVSGQILVLPLASGHVRVGVPTGQTTRTARTYTGGQSASLGQHDPGVELYQRRDVQLDPRIGELLAQADRLIAQNRLTTPKGASAVDSLEEVLLIDPYNPAALAMFRKIYSKYLDLAMLAMQRHQYGQAARYAQSALDVLGRDVRWFGVTQGEVARIYFLQGDAMAVQGHPAAARSAYMRALNLNPGFEEARVALEDLDNPELSRQSPPPETPAPQPTQNRAARSGPLDAITGI